MPGEGRKGQPFLLVPLPGQAALPLGLDRVPAGLRRTGIGDLLRLLYAREAVDPEGTALTRSHFSFNHPIGQCPACRGLGVQDLVDPELLVAHPDRSIRDGALRPTLKNGYTVVVLSNYDMPIAIEIGRDIFKMLETE